MLLASSGLSAEAACRYVRDGGVAPENCPKPRALRDLLAGKHGGSNKHETLGPLLRWAQSYALASGDGAMATSGEFADAQRLSAELDRDEGAAAPSGPPSRQGEAVEPAAGAPLDTLEAIRVVASLMHVQWQDFVRLQARLFDAKDFRKSKNRSERHFLCYRYHSDPGKIAKSFLALEGPAPAVPGICCFTNFYKATADAVRCSNGIVLPMRNATYLVGEVDRGAGLKVIVVRDLSTGRARYEGLVLSLDDDLNVVASRIVLVPTKLKRHHHAGIGVREEADLAAEIKDIRNLLRNRVDFKLSESVFFDGVRMSQQAMVVKIEELLRNPDTGKLRLTDGHGNEFNPAATEHYTFNAALRIWNASDEG